MKRLFHSRLMLIPLGILVGLTARAILGAPEMREPPMQLDPYSELQEVKGQTEATSEPIDLRREPLVEPLLIEVPIWRKFDNVADVQPFNPKSTKIWLAQFDQFAHDSEATFHPHGDQVCASGCAASNHPTEDLTALHFESLLGQFSQQPLTESSDALEELLFFGPQTLACIEDFGVGPLDRKRTQFLLNELKIGHARVYIRVIDEHGQVRSWNKPTLVPFDRRHVFEMQTNQVQNLVTSGTVKRVGLHHIWIRL